MKKLFQLFLIPLFIGLLLGGCGGVGGDADGDGDPALHSVTLKEKSLALDETRQEGNLTLEVTTTQAEDLKLELTDFRLFSDKYEITVLEVTPSTLVSDVSGRYEVTIRFRYKTSASTRALTSSDFGFKVSYRKVIISKISHSSVSETVVVSVESAPSVTPPGEGEEEGSSENAYIEISYFMASSTVSEPGESLEIVIQANDKNSTPLKPAAGVAIDILPLAPADGSMDALRKTTDANGRVTFSYSAPSVITPGREVNLTIYVENHPDVKVEIPITFTATQSGVQTGDLEISLPDSQLLITEGGVSRTIVAQLSDKTTRQPVEGMDIVVSTFDLTHGMLDKYRATTDENGRVFFNYTAPDDITALYGGEFAIEMKLEANASVAQTLQVRFDRPNGGDTASYRIQTPAKSVTITKAGESKKIDAYLVDGDNRPVAGMNVLVDFFDPAKGTMDRYSAATDSNGHVVFNYTAPSDISSLDGTTLTLSLKLEANSSVAQDVTVAFDSSGGYAFTLESDENITVTSSGSDSFIYVTLSYKDENNLSHPAIGETVYAEFIQQVYGKLDSYSATTDESGIAVFVYTAPTRIQNLDDINITFHWDANPNLFDTTRVVFDAQNDRQVSNLYLVPEEVLVTEPGQVQTIKLVTVNAKNVGVSTDIQIEQPTNGDGVDYGTFDTTNLKTDESGLATVTYTAPSSLPGNIERNITVTELSQNKQKVLVLRFQNAGDGAAKIYDINVTSTNPLHVDEEGALTVTIHEKGDPERLIDSKSVLDVNVTSRFVDLLDFKGTTVYNYEGFASKLIPLQTKHISGAALVDVQARIFDGEKNVTLTHTASVLILSGPVTTLSLVYVNSSYNEETGLFEDVWSIHAVDRYSNPAQEGVYLFPTLVNGVKVASRASGEIRATDPVEFADTVNSPFGNVDVSEDRLIVLPQGNPERIDKAYLGDWTITSVVDTSTLELNESFYGSTTDQLRYVVGGEKRVLADEIALADIKSADPNRGYATDANGNVLFKVTYDPLLAGHTYTLSAKAYEDGNRSGTAIRTSFRALGRSSYASTSETIDNDGGSHDVWLQLSIVTPNGGSSHLVDVDIVPGSIVSDSRECALDARNSDLHTDDDGWIRARIDTSGDTNKAETCTITWALGKGSIYYEY